MDVPDATRESARTRDEAGLAAAFGDRFDAPSIYLDGNSIAPVSEDSEAALDRALEQWREFAIEGWPEADPEWFTYGERLGDRLAPLVGARPDEVVAANSTTVNIHTLAGWWGHEKATQFDMNLTYTPAESAGAFQIGTVPVLAAAPPDGAPDVIEAAGIDRIRAESVALTEYLAHSSRT